MKRFLRSAWLRRLAASLAALASASSARAQDVVLTTLHSTGNVGNFSSIAIGADGLGLISYYNQTSGELWVAHCSNVLCTTATLSLLDYDPNVDVGAYTSLTIGGDGRGLISYHDRTHGTLKVAHCDSIQCSNATNHTIDAFGRGRIATGADGLGLLAYGLPQGEGLRVAHCQDAVCASVHVTEYAGGGRNVGLMIGTDGLGLIVDNVDTPTGPSLRALHCANVECSSATTSTLATGVPGALFAPALAPDTAGSGFLSILRLDPGSLASYFGATCADVACSSAPLLPAPIAGTSVVVGADDHPLLALGETALFVHTCLDAGCAAVRSNPIDGPLSQSPSIAMGADGRPLISYWGAGDLKVAHCTHADCRVSGADLRASLSSSAQGAVAFGEVVTLHARADNSGPDPSPDSILRVTIPQGLILDATNPPSSACSFDGSQVTCNVGTVGVGQQADVDIHTVVDLAPTSTVMLLSALHVSGGLPDADPANSIAGTYLSVNPRCSIDSDVAVQEGDAGTSAAVFTVRYSGFGTAAVGYGSADGTATAGMDYVAVNGTLTFPSGPNAVTVAVPILGDTTLESDETFRLDLFSVGFCGSTGAAPEATATATIVDDDAPALSTRELSHGSSEWHTLTQGRIKGAPWTDLFRLRQAPYASYEILVDGASADMRPFALERLAADNATVVSSSAAVRNAASLRWENDGIAVVDNQHLRVHSAGCGSGCGADDVYRVRAYETTAALARYNNAGGQVSIVILQNTSSDSVSGHLRFWSPDGTARSSRAFTLAPRASLVLDTTYAPGLSGTSGSITVSHDGTYGALAGKAISLEPGTGFSFDTTLEYRPR